MMIPPVDPVSLGAVPEPDALGQTIVTEQDVARFETAMDRPEAVNQTLQISSPEVVAPQQPLSTVLLNLVEDVRQSQNAHLDKISGVTSGADETKPMEMSDLFSLQFELMQLTLQQDVTTKVADRLSQGVQTLFRNQ